MPPLWKPLLLCLFLAACAPPSVPPLSSGESAFHREIIGRLEARQAAVRTLSGMARVVIRNRKFRFAGNEIIHLVLPDRLHLETHDLLGGLQMLLVAQGEKGFLLFPAKSTARSFSPEKKNLKHFFGVNLTIAELVRILAGTPPLPPLTPEGIRSERDGNTIVLSLLDPGRIRLRVRINGTGEVLRWDRLDGWGKEDESLFFDEFREVDGVRFPFRIRLEKNGKTLLSIRYHSIHLNRSIDSGLFEVPPVFRGGNDR